MTNQIEIKSIDVQDLDNNDIQVLTELTLGSDTISIMWQPDEDFDLYLADESECDCRDEYQKLIEFFGIGAKNKNGDWQVGENTDYRADGALGASRKLESVRQAAQDTYDAYIAS